jgi:hypothetical protein
MDEGLEDLGWMVDLASIDSHGAFPLEDEVLQDRDGLSERFCLIEKNGHTGNNR